MPKMANGKKINKIVTIQVNVVARMNGHTHACTRFKKITPNKLVSNSCSQTVFVNSDISLFLIESLIKSKQYNKQAYKA